MLIFVAFLSYAIYFYYEVIGINKIYLFGEKKFNAKYNLMFKAH